MSIEKKSLISTLKTTKKANAAEGRHRGRSDGQPGAEAADRLKKSRMAQANSSG